MEKFPKKLLTFPQGGGRISIEVKWQNQVTHALNIFNHNKRKGDFIMKKILSIILCLALLLSVCSFSLTTFARSVIQVVLFEFNEGDFNIEMTWNYDHTTGNETMELKTYNCLNEYFHEAVASNKNYTLVEVPGQVDLEYVFEQFVPNSDLLEILECDSSHKSVSEFLSNVTKTLVFSNSLDDSGIALDEDEVAYIISALNPSSLNKIEIYSDVVTEVSPIVDALLSTCQNTLSIFRCSSKNVNEIDNRLLTDFPKLTSASCFLNCDFWSDDDSLEMTLSRPLDQLVSDGKTVYLKMSQNEWIDALRLYDYGDCDFLEDYFYQNEASHISMSDNVSMTVENLGFGLFVYFEYTQNGKSISVGSFNLKILVKADVTRDNVVDSFDVAMTTECVNTFEEPEDEAVMTAMDVVADGYIDATDLAYVSYIANFEG